MKASTHITRRLRRLLVPMLAFAAIAVPAAPAGTDSGLGIPAGRTPSTRDRRSRVRTTTHAASARQHRRHPRRPSQPRRGSSGATPASAPAARWPSSSWQAAGCSSSGGTEATSALLSKALPCTSARAGSPSSLASRLRKRSMRGAKASAMHAARAPRARVAGGVVEADQQPRQHRGLAATAMFAHGTHASARKSSLLPAEYRSAGTGKRGSTLFI